MAENVRVLYSHVKFLVFWELTVSVVTSIELNAPCKKPRKLLKIILRNSSEIQTHFSLAESV